MFDSNSAQNNGIMCGSHSDLCLLHDWHIGTTFVPVGQASPDSWEFLEELFMCKWFGTPPCLTNAPSGRSYDHSGHGFNYVSESGSHLNSLYSIEPSLHRQSLKDLQGSGGCIGSPASVSANSNVLTAAYLQQPSAPASPPAAVLSNSASSAPIGMRPPGPEMDPSEPLLGTWALRQYRMPVPSQNQEPSAQQPAAAAAPANNEPAPKDPSRHGPGSYTAQQAISIQQPTQHVQPAGTSNTTAASHDADVDDEADAAWRWRFARRWHAEQARALDPDRASSTNDRLEEALQFLNAGGGAGWHMQLNPSRMTSSDVDGLGSLVSTPFGAGGSLLNEMMFDEGSWQYSVLASSMKRTGTMGGDSSAGDTPAAHRSAARARSDILQATREVSSLHRRAENLLQQQAELERAADERWREMSTSDGTWVGNYMDTVEIDDWGTFKFVVVRLRGRGDKQRVLIRGRNYCTEANVLEAVNLKMSQLARQYGVTVETVEVMGGGVMEWRRDRDRHLNIHSGFITSSSGSQHGGQSAGKPTCVQELLNLACVLTKQSLPVHFKVSIDGGKSMV